MKALTLDFHKNSCASYEMQCIHATTNKHDAKIEAKMVNQNRIYTNNIVTYSYIQQLIFALTTKLLKLKGRKAIGGHQVDPDVLHKQWRALLRKAYFKYYKKNNHPNPIMMFPSLDENTNIWMSNGAAQCLGYQFARALFRGKTNLIYIDDQSNEMVVNLLTQGGK